MPTKFEEIMSNTLTKTKTDYKVADITLADFGRKEILLAEAEMPGLMSVRKKYGPTKNNKTQKIITGIVAAIL